jgi:hypothetical protein
MSLKNEFRKMVEKLASKHVLPPIEHVFPYELFNYFVIYINYS